MTQDRPPVAAAPVERARWSSLPGDAPASLGPPTLVAAIVGSLPLAVQMDRIWYAVRLSVLTALLGWLLLEVARRVPSWVPLVGAGGVGAIHLVFVGYPAPSPTIVFMGVASPLLWGAALGVVRPLWWVAPRSPLREMTMAPAVIASFLLLTREGVRPPAALIAVSGVLLGVAGLLDRHVFAKRSVAGPPSGLRRQVGRFGERALDGAGRLLGAVAMLPAALVVLLSWTGQKLTGASPLAAPVAPGSNWVRRQGDDPGPERLFARVGTRDSAVGMSVRRVGSSLLVAAVLGAGVFEVRHLIETGEPFIPLRTKTCSIGEEDPVMGEDPGWPLIACETDEFGRTGRFDAVAVYRFPDYEGEHLNVVDGKRRTWQPPCEDCDPLRVWWFGGSAAWGWWQRDEFTIPSQLARLAWERGVPIEVTNYAMPGWTLGQEVRTFGRLIVEEDPPDVVMFYDGGNDLNKQKDRNGEGRGSDESEVSFSETVIDDVLVNGPFPWGQTDPEGRRVGGRPSAWPADDGVLPPAEVAGHAMVRYERNVRLGRLLAEAVGATPVFLWQPLLPSSLPNGGSEDFMTPEDAEAWAEMLPVARRSLPEGVVDLSDSLDDVDRWVFKDVWHTNEEGARIVADALLDASAEVLGVPGGTQG